MSWIYWIITVIVIVSAVMLVALGAMLYKSRSFSQEFEAESLAIDAVLEEKMSWITPHHGQAYDMIYSYSVDGLNYTDRATTYQEAIYLQYEVGDMIPIRYMPNDPRISELVDDLVPPVDADNRLATALLAGGGLMLIVGFGSGLMRVIRQRKPVSA